MLPETLVFPSAIFPKTSACPPASNLCFVRIINAIMHNVIMQGNSKLLGKKGKILITVSDLLSI